MATVDGVATEHGAASPTAPTPPTQQSPPPRSPPGLSPPPLDHAATADSIEHALLVHPADSFPDLVHLRVEDSQEGDDGDVVARLHKTVEEMTAFLDAPTLPVAPDATGGGDADVGDLVRAAVLDFLVPAAPSIRQDNDMEILAGELLRHPAVDADVEAALRCLVGLFKETPLRALPLSQKDADTVYVVLSLIYHLGQISSNVYRRFADLDAVELIRPVIVGCQGLRMHAPAVRLLFEVCQTQELSLSDLNEMDDDLIDSVLSLIESTRADQLEEYNYSLIQLIMAINHQFVLKNQARTVVPNRVIAHLAARPYLGKTLGENVIFMFNRAEDDRLQNLLLRFLYTVFRSEETAGFFYTNDLRIILDVILRECRTISTDDHALLHGYLSVMTLLLRDPALHSYKPRDTRRLLEDLGAPSPAPPSPLPAPPASPRTARRPPPPPPPRRSCSSASSSSTSSSFSSSSKPFTPVTPSSPASSATAAASSLRAASDPIPDPATAPSGSWTPRRLAAAVLRDHPDYFSGA